MARKKSEQNTNPEVTISPTSDSRDWIDIDSIPAIATGVAEAAASGKYPASYQPDGFEQFFPIMVPLAPLRAAIVERQKNGQTILPLSEVLRDIKRLVKEHKENGDG